MAASKGFMVFLGGLAVKIRGRVQRIPRTGESGQLRQQHGGGDQQGQQQAAAGQQGRELAWRGERV